MTVNGQSVECDETITIHEFLEKSGYRLDRIAVEVNEEIVPKCQYDTRRFREDDKIEIIHFVGGG